MVIKPEIPIPGPVNPPAPMGGWKMKLGSLLIAVGALIVGSGEVAPIPEMVPWLKFVGFIVGGVGTAFLAWGAGHKLEKNRPIIIRKKNVPYYIQKIEPDELKWLEEMRKSKKVEPPTL